jgi:hypothetical protein
VLPPFIDEKGRPITETMLDAEQLRADSVDKRVTESKSFGCAATESCEAGAEWTARFVREVIPLLDQLFPAARRMTRNHADAEDLLQDTMLSAYVGFRSFRPGTNPKAWLFSDHEQ